jgi:hopanoid biosynthesis associated radical SAM protein HpnJ
VKAHELIVIHTSTPSFKSDVKTAGMIRALNPKAKIGFIGAKVAVEPQESLEACPALDFVCRNEYEFTIQELANGADWSTIKGLSYRDKDGRIVHNPEREILTDMDRLPSVLPLYKQLQVENYFGGYLLHPYMSWYTGRGCKSRCTFCLWPQTIGGHKYRYRSIEKVVEEVKYVQKEFPQIREIFFDDDTLTDNHDRVEELARALGPLGITWSCNAKANVPRKTLEVMRANGLRLLLVGYESGNQKILHNIKKGLLVEVAKRFARDCHELGILVHGTFILGLPGETRETIQETLAFAKEVNPRTLQVSLAAPYPGTFLYKQAKENGWFASDIDLLTDDGTQIAPLNYPHLGHTEIFESVEEFYRKFYFRPSKIAEIVGEMLTSRQMLVRRLREGVEFFQFLRNREDMIVS